MATETKLPHSKISDRDRSSLQSEVGSHEQRINEAVFKLYGMSAPPT